jgi:SAM-dependent methyltransferase
LVRDYVRLDEFLKGLEKDVNLGHGPEPHRQITHRVIDMLLREKIARPGMQVIDVGPGAGFALNRFIKEGLACVGVDIVDGCYDEHMDQSFMQFEPESVDMVWARHVLEHSVIPYFTLREYHRLIRPGGWAYVEVPAPDTACDHETNPNHYSVLGPKMWARLMQRAGFTVHAMWDFLFEIPQGEAKDAVKVQDKYIAFLLKKGEPDADKDGDGASMAASV